MSSTTKLKGSYVLLIIPTTMANIIMLHISESRIQNAHLTYFILFTLCVADMIVNHC